MAESIYILDAAAQLTDVLAILGSDTLGYSNYDRSLGLEKAFDLLDECIHIEWKLRKIDSIRSVTVLTLCKSCSACKPSGISSHNLNDDNLSACSLQ